MLNYGNTDELAEFQVVARSIYFALVSVFSWPLGRFMFPEFSSLIGDKQYKTLYNLRMKFIKLLIVFGLLVISGCWILSKIVIAYLFPIEYLNSYKMLNILIVALPFVMYQNFSESIIKAVGDYKTNLIIKSSGIILFILSYMIFEFYFQIDLASIYAFMFGMIGIFVLSLYYEIKIRKGWDTI
jgi:O-antigen/teichoic acid export membrane protein